MTSVHATPSHEDPLYLVLPAGMRAGEALARFIDDARIRHYQLPPVWAFERAGLDLPSAMPEVACITRENLEPFLRDLTLLCDGPTLDRLVARTWLSVDETVRDHYLRRNTLQTFAAIFRVGPRSTEQPPPPDFRADRIHDHGFELQYRLAPERGPSSPLAPTEEGSLMYYPFDPANASGRAEAGLGAGEAVVLEAFAYEAGRARHREVLEAIGREVGFEVIERAV